MLLIRGSIGPQVTELQEALNILGYEVVVDGTYGATTEEAVMEFQAASNIGADGAYGPATHKKLQAALAAAENGEEPAAPAVTRIPNIPLVRGSVGPNVELLQEALNAVGYEVVVDGTYGATTEEAVMAFQAASNIGADGAYGPATFEMLLAALDDSDGEDGDEDEG